MRYSTWRNHGREKIPKKVDRLFDQGLLPLTDIERLLPDQMFPFDREAL
jgi:hypothetical protein